MVDDSEPAVLAYNSRLYSVEELLPDGASIYIRAIRLDDRERLVEHFQGLSARSVYFRFSGAMRRLTDSTLGIAPATAHASPPTGTS